VPGILAGRADAGHLHLPAHGAYYAIAA
jgi:hypothetical protein